MSQASQLGGQNHGACLRRGVTKRCAYEFPGGSTLDMFWLCRCLVICFCLKRMDCGQRPESPYVLKENVNVWYLISRSGAEVCKLKAAHKDLKPITKEQKHAVLQTTSQQTGCEPPKKGERTFADFPDYGMATPCDVMLLHGIT